MDSVSRQKPHQTMKERFPNVDKLKAQTCKISSCNEEEWKKIVLRTNENENQVLSARGSHSFLPNLLDYFSLALFSTLLYSFFSPSPLFSTLL